MESVAFFHCVTRRPVWYSFLNAHSQSPQPEPCKSTQLGCCLLEGLYSWLQTTTATNRLQI